MNTCCPPKCVPSADRFFTPCSHLGATASEDNAARGNLQASPQALGQTTGVAGARRAEDTLADLNPPGRRSANCAPPPGNFCPRSAMEYPGLEGYRAHPALQTERL
ncbi:UNVERIFIED_CONTAM: hypothetical protein FKN15_076043 [Acipenser sinensis]